MSRPTHATSYGEMILAVAIYITMGCAFLILPVVLYKLLFVW